MLCRFPARRLPPTNAERVFWLSKFSDDEIAMMSQALFGTGEMESVTIWRARLKVVEP